MANPVPYTVAASGESDDAPAGAIPIALYGAGSGGDVPAPPVSGVYFLHSDDGVLSWIDSTELTGILNG